MLNPRIRSQRQRHFQSILHTVDLKNKMTKVLCLHFHQHHIYKIITKNFTNMSQKMIPLCVAKILTSFWPGNLLSDDDDDFVINVFRRQGCPH